MRSLFFLLGAGLSGLGLWLGWKGAFLVEALRQRGQFSLAVWRDTFWFAEPSEPFAGLGPNAEWFLLGLGGLLLVWLGWNFLSTSLKMRE